MVIGVLIGWLLPESSAASLEAALSTIFLRMIKSLIVPLIFGTLVVGIAGHGDDMKRVGRLAFKSIIYFEIVTTLALFIGLAAVNLVQAGRRRRSSAASAEHGQAARRRTRRRSPAFLEHIVPQSFFEAAAKNEVLQIVFLSILFAVALTQVRGQAEGGHARRSARACAEVMFKFTGIVMKYAPIGIGAAIAVTVGHSGLGVLINLGMLVLTLYGALVVFDAVRAAAGRAAVQGAAPQFCAAVKEPALIAFSTTSSEAALPKRDAGDGATRRAAADRRVRDADGLLVQPRRHDALPRAGRRCSRRRRPASTCPVGQQLLMMLTLMLTSKGVAAVPRASLVILSGTLAHVRAAAGGGRRHPRRGRADGHGAHDGQPGRQLPGDRRDGAVGGRVRAGSRSGPAGAVARCLVV